MSEEENKAVIGRWIEAFNERDLEGEADLLASGYVAARVSFGGTHRGQFQGLPPTGKEVNFTSMEFNREVEGKVEEHWVEIDLLRVMGQLGLVVIPGPRLLGRMLVRRAKKLRSRLSAGR